MLVTALASVAAFGRTALSVSLVLAQLRAMFITRVRIATAVLLGTSLIGLSAGPGAHATSATQPGGVPAQR